jgi:hypothetical protein
MDAVNGNNVLASAPVLPLDFIARQLMHRCNVDINMMAKDAFVAVEKASHLWFLQIGRKPVKSN